MSIRWGCSIRPGSSITSRPCCGTRTPTDEALFELVGKTISETIPAAFKGLALSQAVEAWIAAVFACNAYIDAQAPWALKKTDFERMETVLATLYICIAQLAVAISPIIPAGASKLLDNMGVGLELRNFQDIAGHWYAPLAESGFRLEQPQGLFPRLELPADEETT